ncbi:hypothetical protein CRENBAI_025616 [Crenichthys baileyi]|uniref:peptidylprolyl isomerase n=1 Tax=Crenichthys baileyi TaxID=28760 RepID=A0AAV9RAP5_9TELE
MELELCCEEQGHCVLDPTETEVSEDISKLADSDSLNKLPCGSAEDGEELCVKDPSEIESRGVESKDTEIKSSPNCELQREKAECKIEKKMKKTNSWKMVRFQDPSTEEDVVERDSSAESLFPEYAVEEWTSTPFEELFMAEDWEDITEERLLRKKVLESGDIQVPHSTWGQEVTVKLQGVLEDRTVVEKDCKLVFVIGEGDVIQALEECVMSMQKGEIALLLADSQYAYGLLGRTQQADKKTTPRPNAPAAGLQALTAAALQITSISAPNEHALFSLLQHCHIVVYFQQVKVKLKSNCNKFWQVHTI